MSDKLKIFFILFYLAAIFSLSLTQLVDTDAFTHLSLGREIFNHKGFPPGELFNYPSLENPFGYSEWLFGFILYLAYLFMNVKGVILFKAFVITLTFYLLLKDSFFPKRNVLVSVAVLFFTALFMRYRFVERPDIMLMLFLAFNIYSLDAFVRENKPYIYFLPLVQILWANIHPSVSLMSVPFAAFIIAGLLQRFLQDRSGRPYLLTPSYRQIGVIAVIFIVSILASLINPYKSQQLSAPVSLITSSWVMDEVIELKPPSWDIWKMPFIFSAAILGSFLLAVARKRLSLISLFLVLPFIYIGLSGIRFVFLIGLVGGPVIVRNIDAFFSEEACAKFQRLKIYKAAVAGLTAAILFVTAFTISGRGPFRLQDKVFGLRTGYEQLPEGALKYLDEKGIYGRLFNTFQWGGYITWRDYPKRMTFVDGRGGVSSDLLEALGKARFQPDVLNNLSDRYGFEVVLLHYNPIVSRALQNKDPDVDLGLFAAPKEWALVYWDDVSMVYLKRTQVMKSVIALDEYHYVRPANGYPYLARKLNNPEYRAGMIEELEQNLNKTGSKKARIYLGFMQTETGNPQKTIELLTPLIPPLIKGGRGDFEAYQLMGSAYRRIGDLSKAIHCYNKALSIETSPNIVYNLGMIYLEKGDLKMGIKYLEAVIKKDKGFAAAYPPLIDAYKDMGLDDKYYETKDAFERISSYTEKKAIFERGLKFFTEGRYADAIKEYKRFLEISPSNPAGRSNLGFAYYMTGDYDGAYLEFQKTVEIDPKFPNSYYGLGLVYKKQGKLKDAKNHFEEYLKLDPKGAWARKVREELRELGNR